MDQCSKIAPLLCAYVDDEVTPSERADVEAHVQTCSACREELTMLREAVGLLADVPEVAPPPELREMILTATVWRRPMVVRLWEKVAAASRVFAVRNVAIAGAVAGLVAGIWIARPHAPVSQAVASRSTHRAVAALQATPQPSPTATPSAPAPAPERSAVALAAPRLRPRPRPIEGGQVAVERPAKRSTRAVPAAQTASPAANAAPKAVEPAPDNATVANATTEPTVGAPVAAPGPARAPDTPSTEVAAQQPPTAPATLTIPVSAPKQPVLVAVAAQPPADIVASDTPKERRMRQFAEFNQRLRSEDVHGERPSVNVDLFTMKF